MTGTIRLNGTSDIPNDAFNQLIEEYTGKLLSVGLDAKTVHGIELGIQTGVQYLAPANTSGVMNTCQMASAGCMKSCLFTAGRGKFDSVANARIKRTRYYVFNKRGYFSKIVKEIQALIRKAKREGLIPAIRLNGTSDIPWERVRIKGTQFDGMTLMEAFPDTQFYDYSKVIKRLGNTPDNYHLTASYSENMTPETMRDILDAGHNVAVVFRVCEHKAKCACKLPTSWRGYTVINGDASDVRFNDPKGVIVGLKAKGDAIDDYTEFVIRIIAVRI